MVKQALQMAKITITGRCALDHQANFPSEYLQISRALFNHFLGGVKHWLKRVTLRYSVQILAGGGRTSCADHTELYKASKSQQIFLFVCILKYAKQC